MRQLIGLLAALKRFISRFTDRLNPFFTILKGDKLTDRNKECDQAFMAIKQYLNEPPILASPEAGDMLYLYLVVSDVLVSAALFEEDENRKTSILRKKIPI